MGPTANNTSASRVAKRTEVWYVILLLIVSLFLVRAFYLQVIRYGYYHKAALSDQLKQYEIPATRGTISAHQGDTTVPIVLNEKLYTVYADPTLVKDPGKVAATLANLLGGKPSDYESKLKPDGNLRYVILGKKVSETTQSSLLKYKYPGVGAQEQDYRTYPDGQLASQLLGFVDASGNGQYGVEQALNKQLSGTPGALKAVTDVNGVPLASNSSNVSTPAVAGKDITLTVDVGMQKQMEDILAKRYKDDKAKGVSAVVMDPNTGAIKAMANYPTYDPSNYGDVSDASVYNNNAATNPIEVGSVMKTLTTAAAINTGAITANETYYDPAKWTVDGFTITNIEEDGGAGRKSIADLLNLSLNTGATWELMQMGGGKLDQKARDTWYSYMTDHFQLGKTTGLEQGNEAPGYIPKPEDNGAGIDLTYANTSFGQGMTATTVQMAAAISSVLNGGTYYKPYLVDSMTDTNGNTTTTKPTVVKKDVVSPSLSGQMQSLMEYVVQNHHIVPGFDQSTYAVGGKTGTAQIAKPGGGYYDDEYNGTYLGFVGGDKVQYVIAVFVYQPKKGGYAGTAAAQPVFADLAHMLINDFNITPKTKK